ncbi:unnamed protein product [Linum tenue]|uniref:BHLH domain-containing protein n=2 Tax=Linum tenue TaxID=586396 RepID=A0AAV0PGY5_9ROSI|nr:unnamed protein product [Linum tenue]
MQGTLKRNLARGQRRDQGPLEESEIDLQPKKAKKNVRSKKVGKKQNSSAGAKMEEESNNVKSAAATTTSNSDESLFGGSAADEKIDEGGEAVPTTSASTGSITVSLNGKTRASRGAATDPQSLYARKRRERINERLKVLQTLVPNGTKVDISTMLEEAVQYVKFLQLQIKLLSSDDHWMYSPIAYNGMDIGVSRCS